MNNLSRGAMLVMFAVLLAVSAMPMLAQLPELDLSISTHRQRLDPGERAAFTATVA